MPSTQPQSFQWLSFRLSGREYALSVSDVVEVLGMVALTCLPEAPPWLAGMLNLRGQVVPVLDLRVRLGLAPLPVGLNTPIIVAQSGSCRAGCQPAHRKVGFIVDEVTEVLVLPADALVLPDDLAGTAHLVTALARADDRLIMLLNLERICDPALALADGNADL